MVASTRLSYGNGASWRSDAASKLLGLSRVRVYLLDPESFPDSESLSLDAWQEPSCDDARSVLIHLQDSIDHVGVDVNADLSEI